MDAIRIRYKCRNCGEVFEKKSAKSILNFEQQITDNPFLGDRNIKDTFLMRVRNALMFQTHLCKDKVLGVGDVIGAIE